MTRSTIRNRNEFHPALRYRLFRVGWKPIKSRKRPDGAALHHERQFFRDSYIGESDLRSPQTIVFSSELNGRKYNQLLRVI
jgi:hypothetical protein